MSASTLQSDDESCESDTGILGSIGRKLVTTTSLKNSKSKRLRNKQKKSDFESVINDDDECCNLKSIAQDDTLISALERLSIQGDSAKSSSKLGFRQRLMSGKEKNSRFVRDLVPPKIQTSVRHDDMNKSTGSEMYYSTDSDHMQLGSSGGISSVLMSLPSRSNTQSTVTSSSTIAPVHHHEHLPFDAPTNPNTPASAVTGFSSPISLSPQKHQEIDRTNIDKAIRRQRSEEVKKGKWSLGEKIGSGSFGTVHRGLNQRNGSFIAVKCLNILVTDRKHIDDFQREVDLMQVLTHPNIVRYLGAEVNEDAGILYIFQEWVPGGSVASVLDKFGPLGVDVVRKYLRQVLQGLNYLHCHEIAHRDIKGGNILIDVKGQIKLGDFGASKHIENGAMASSMKGTPYFMAPEVFQEQYDGKKADVWSLGGAALQMITAEPPWRKLNFQNTMALFLYIKESSGPPPMPNDCPNVLSDLLIKCFDRKPRKRPSVSDLLKHPFFHEEELDDEISCSSVSTTTPTNKGSGLLLPTTPKVDVHSASRRALLRSEEKRRKESDLNVQSSKSSPIRNEYLIGGNVTKECAELHSKVNDIVEVADTIEDAISPLSCSGINEEWPTWTKDVAKEENNESQLFFPPSPDKYKYSKQSIQPLYSSELLPPIVSKSMPRQSARVQALNPSLDTRDDLINPDHASTLLYNMKDNAYCSEGYHRNSSSDRFGTKLPPISPFQANGKHPSNQNRSTNVESSCINEPETPLVSNRRSSRRRR